jgi:membrane associated rhomboid family serine protease
VGYGITEMPALAVIGLWFVLQLFSGVGSLGAAADTGGIAFMAHIGGFIAGVVLAFFLRGYRVA